MILGNDTKDTWCTQQEASCDSLCQDEFQGDPDTNTCSSDDLQFSCICPGGLSPNTTQYAFSLQVQLYTEHADRFQVLSVDPIPTLHSEYPTVFRQLQQRCKMFTALLQRKEVWCQ